MKTIIKENITSSLMSFAMILMIALSSNSLFAQTTQVAIASSAEQEFTVKGKVTDEQGPLPGVNIILKGTKVGAITDENGLFTFPQALSSGDVLVFSFLGYEKQEITVTPDNTYISLLMSSELIEIMGAPNSDTPYKSKRTK